MCLGCCFGCCLRLLLSQPILLWDLCRGIRAISLPTKLCVALRWHGVAPHFAGVHLLWHLLWELDLLYTFLLMPPHCGVWYSRSGMVGNWMSEVRSGSGVEVGADGIVLGARGGAAEDFDGTPLALAWLRVSSGSGTTCGSFGEGGSDEGGCWMGGREEEHGLGVGKVNPCINMLTFSLLEEFLNHLTYRNQTKYEAYNDKIEYCYHMIRSNDQRFGTYKCCFVDGVQHKLRTLKQCAWLLTRWARMEAYSDNTSCHLDL